jgi:hypothetical protein
MVEVKEQQKAARLEGKKGARSESIQFNNQDVHLNKRINEAKNSMKCDAIHRTHTQDHDVMFQPRDGWEVLHGSW